MFEVKINTNAREVLKQVQARMNMLNLKEKFTQVLVQLLNIGFPIAYAELVANADYDGINDIQIDTEVDAENGTATLTAKGQAVLFVEFGTGITYVYGHPMDLELGFGPGTYPPKNPNNPNWSNPQGWYYGQRQHTYGNKPNMGMYHARNEMLAQINNVVREIFNQ